MQSRSRRIVAWAPLVIAAAAGSCSGGGGGPGDAYTISPTGLSFTARGGGARPPPQNVEVTAVGAAVFVKTQISGAAVESATIQTTSATTAAVSIQPAGPAALPDGVSTAQVSIIGCKDVVCSGEVPGSPKIVSVKYTKSTGGITGTPASLSFTSAVGSAGPAAQSVTLSDLGAASLAWTSTVTYANANGAGWLTVAPASGGALPATASVSATPISTPGTYHATIQFAEGTASLFDVAATYTVTTPSAAFQVSPGSLNVVGAFGSATPDQHLSLTDGQSASYPWTARIEYPTNDLSGWATPSPASGNSVPATLTLSLGALPDRLTHQATVHVTAAGTDRQVSISYRTP